MIQAIVLVEDASNILSKWSQVTSKTIRKIDDNEGINGIVKLRKEKKSYSFPFVPIRSCKDIDYLTGINLNPREVLIVTLRESSLLYRLTGKKNKKFYHYIDSYGWLVVLPAIQEKYIAEFVATFFLNFKQETKGGKLSNLV